MYRAVLKITRLIVVINLPQRGIKEGAKRKNGAARESTGLEWRRRFPPSYVADPLLENRAYREGDVRR